MLSYTDLKKGTLFVMNGEAYEVVESNFSRMQQRKAVVQAKIRNVNSGKILERSFQPSDQFEEANVQKRPLLLLYKHRGEYVFVDPKNKGNRFSLPQDNLDEHGKWLKPNTEVTAIFFNEKLLGIILPVKMDFTVTEATPGVQGDRSQSGTKAATIETGVTIQVPLFIHTGDIIRVNTQSGDYVERVEKA